MNDRFVFFPEHLKDATPAEKIAFLDSPEGRQRLKQELLSQTSFAEALQDYQPSESVQTRSDKKEALVCQSAAVHEKQHESQAETTKSAFEQHDNSYAMPTSAISEETVNNSGLTDLKADDSVNIQTKSAVKVCPRCHRNNNPTFTQCWKCFESFSGEGRPVIQTRRSSFIYFYLVFIAAIGTISFPDSLKTRQSDFYTWATDFFTFSGAVMIVALFTSMLPYIIYRVIHKALTRKKKHL